jgi:hypothetical protein
MILRCVRYGEKRLEELSIVGKQVVFSSRDCGCSLQAEIPGEVGVNLLREKLGQTFLNEIPA